MRRRDVLRSLAATAPLTAPGCLASLPGRGSPDASPSPGGEAPSCDDHIYREPASTEVGALPWDLQIRNIGLEVYPVTVEIADVSGSTPTVVAACTATEAAHERLVFDLPAEAEYRVRATLHRPAKPAAASTTVSGAQLARPNAALEITVDRGVGFAIREIHVDG